MKSQSFFSVFFCLLPFFLSGQYEEELDVFHRLSVFGNMEVRLVKGETPRLELPYDDELPDRFRMELADGKLSLRLVDRIPDWDESTFVILTYTGLDELWVHAGVVLEADQPIEAEEIKMESTSGAQVELEVYADRLEAYATEGGMLKLSGKVRAQRLKVSTGGEYNGYRLSVSQLEARANTGGTARVWVTERLKARAYTGGAIHYKGEPDKLDVNSGVAGSIEEY